MKPVVFVGDSLERVREFPDGARRQTGQELRRVQRGLEPLDWKPMRSIGIGVREIRVRELAGAFRIVYIATMAEAVYVLHAFQKKAQKTARRDLDLATLRLRLLQ